MYIDELQIENFRCFSKQSVQFMHPDSPRATGVRFPNVNVVLGANGVGKTTLLKAAALATLNPIMGQTGFLPYALVRRVTSVNSSEKSIKYVDVQKIIIAGLRVNFKIHDEDSLIFESEGKNISFIINIRQKFFENVGQAIYFGQENSLSKTKPARAIDNMSDSNRYGAFFAVAYGAMRRVERLPSYEMSAQSNQYSYRYLRMANLFDSRVVLTPLVSWLSQLSQFEKKKILKILAKLMPGKLEFSDSIEGREFSFYHNKILVPFDALADGHRSYIGWISDLLYHLYLASPSDIQNVSGVVLVDEVDLLAHPTWQRTIVPDLSRIFPKLQFIITTHSPIVAASVEAANLFILEPGRNGTAKLRRPDAEVYGLNAQQVLHEVFGMDSTRATGFDKELRALAKKSRSGDRVAARALMQGLAFGDAEPVTLENDPELIQIQRAAKALLKANL